MERLVQPKLLLSFSLIDVASDPAMLLCIGGVCVPYSAVFPLIILALKWVLVRLAQMGLLPKVVADALQVSSTGDEKGVAEEITAAGPSIVKTLESKQEFQTLLDKKDHKVVCKFTARYEKICRTWNISLLTVFFFLSSNPPLFI